MLAQEEVAGVVGRGSHEFVNGLLSWPSSILTLDSCAGGHRHFWQCNVSGLLLIGSVLVHCRCLSIAVETRQVPKLDGQRKTDHLPSGR